MPDTAAYLAFIAAARSAMERAHEAAAGLRGPELRQGLEDALAALGDAIPVTRDAAAAAHVRRIAQALRLSLDDLSAGKLVDLGELVEQVRRDLRAAVSLG